MFIAGLLGEDAHIALEDMQLLEKQIYRHSDQILQQIGTIKRMRQGLMNGQLGAGKKHGGSVKTGMKN